MTWSSLGWLWLPQDRRKPFGPRIFIEFGEHAVGRGRSDSYKLVCVAALNQRIDGVEPFAVAELGEMTGT